MAGSYSGTLLNNDGTPVNSALVTVYNAGVDVLATLYSDANNTPLANPVQTNSSGVVTFFVADGEYTLVYYDKTNSPHFINVEITADSGTYAARLSTFYPEDYGAKGDGTTDDTAAIQAAIDAAFAAGSVIGEVAAGVVQFKAKTYLCTAAPRTDRGGNAILALPNQSNAAVGGAPVILRGVLPQQNYNPADSRGTVIKTTITGRSYSGTYGAPSVIGGPTREQVGAAFSYMTVAVEDLAVNVPANPTVAGIDLGKIARAQVDGLGVISTPVAGDFVQPTSVHAFALRMPTVQNYNLSLIKSANVAGFYVGYVANSEHFTVLDATAKWCYIGYAPTSLAGQGGIGANAGHATSIVKMSVEWCAYTIAGWTESAGLGNITEDVFVRIGLLDIEDGPQSKWYTRITHIYDPTNHLRGVADISWYSGTTQTRPLTVNGAQNFVMRNVAAPTAALAQSRARASRTSGDLTSLSATADAVIPGMPDLTVRAKVGDLLRITYWALVSAHTSGASANNLNLTAYTLPAGSALNSIAGGSSNIIPSLFVPDALTGLDGSALYTVVAGDLNADGISVTLRAYYRTDNGSSNPRTIYSSATIPLSWQVENLGT